MAADSAVARGNFMGSGRACYGMLTITSRAITWMTPFSFCRTSPYTIVDRRDAVDGLTITYLLAKPSAGCLYDVLVLTHRAGEDNGIGWNVTGYLSLNAKRQDREEERLDCYLYRPSLPTE